MNDMDKPWNIRVTEKGLRTAAIKRLKEDHGVSVPRNHWTDKHVAIAVKKAVPWLDGEDLTVIKQFVMQRNKEAVSPRNFTSTNRVYRPSSDRAMALAMERLGDTPKQIALVSKVPLTSMDTRQG